MKKTALQLLIEKWKNEIQQPLGILKHYREHHVDDIKIAAREVREIKKRIDQATELLETEREQIKEAYDCGHMQGSDRGLGDEFEAQQYYKYTYE